MPQVLTPNEKFLGHLPYSIPRFFICAECEGTVVTKYHPDGVLVECASNKLHSGLKRMTQEVSQEDQSGQDLLDFASSDPEVKSAMREHQKRMVKALWGE